MVSEPKDGIDFIPIGTMPQIIDPTVFEINGKWYMIGWNGRNLDLFSSEDGLNFENEKELEIKGEVCDAFKSDEQVYLYCHLIEREIQNCPLQKHGWCGLGKCRSGL